MKILKPTSFDENLQIIITTFYCFTTIKEGIHLFRDKLEDFCLQNNILGTVLIAEEGINGTLSLNSHSAEKLYTFFAQYEDFANITTKNFFNLFGELN